MERERTSGAVNLSIILSHLQTATRLSIPQQQICHQIFNTFPGRLFCWLYKFNLWSLQRHSFIRHQLKWKASVYVHFKRSFGSVIKKQWMEIDLIWSMLSLKGSSEDGGGDGSDPFQTFLPVMSGWMGLVAISCYNQAPRTFPSTWRRWLLASMIYASYD